jgi:predicted metal-dependent enzyme (double-stranded beta helix superfamily)
MTETPQELIARLAGFTPGPWDAALEKGCHGVVACILGDEFNMVALIGNDTDTPDREPMRFANAALIAAAPDLHRIVTEQQAVIKRLRKAGNWLSVCAQTSGGTSGRDSALVDAISDWTVTLARDALEKEGGE